MGSLLLTDYSHVDLSNVQSVIAEVAKASEKFASEPLDKINICAQSIAADPPKNNDCEKLVELRSAKTFKFLHVCFTSVFLLAMPAESQNIVLSPNSIKNNVFANEILVCSEIDGVSANTILSFYSDYFAGWPLPEIKNATEHRSSNNGSRILFIVSDGSIGDSLRSCLHSQTLSGDELEVYTKQQAENLGQGLGAMEGLNLPSYYNPISASWGYQTTGNWLIVSFMSREDEPYRTNHAITKLFGLDISICEHSSICLTD